MTAEAPSSLKVLSLNTLRSALNFNVAMKCFVQKSCDSPMETFLDQSIRKSDSVQSDLAKDHDRWIGEVDSENTTLESTKGSPTRVGSTGPDQRMLSITSNGDSYEDNDDNDHDDGLFQNAATRESDNGYQTLLRMFLAKNPLPVVITRLMMN